MSILFDIELNLTHNKAMELDKALNLLGLTLNSTLKELNSTFRKLAKRYHPDFNRENESWAHRMMTELNLAYEAALDYITSSRDSYKHTQHTKFKRTFLGEFNKAINRILEGIYVYYQYGLENVHLRKMGVRKIRYKDSLKCLKNGIISLEEINTPPIANTENKPLDIFTDFSKAFFQNMLIEKYYIPSDSAFENNAYKHYYNGSTLLDYAIKEIFFGDMLIRNREGPFYKKLSISYEEFMIILTKYYMSSWIPETILKIYLLEVFTKVIKVFKKLRY